MTPKLTPDAISQIEKLDSTVYLQVLSILPQNIPGKGLSYKLNLSDGAHTMWGMVGGGPNAEKAARLKELAVVSLSNFMHVMKDGKMVLAIQAFSIESNDVEARIGEPVERVFEPVHARPAPTAEPATKKISFASSIAAASVALASRKSQAVPFRSLLGNAAQGVATKVGRPLTDHLRGVVYMKKVTEGETNDRTWKLLTLRFIEAKDKTAADFSDAVNEQCEFVMVNGFASHLTDEQLNEIVEGEMYYLTGGMIKQSDRFTPAGALCKIEFGQNTRLEPDPDAAEATIANTFDCAYLFKPNERLCFPAILFEVGSVEGVYMAQRQETSMMCKVSVCGPCSEENNKLVITLWEKPKDQWPSENHSTMVDNIEKPVYVVNAKIMQDKKTGVRTLSADRLLFLTDQTPKWMARELEATAKWYHKYCHPEGDAPPENADELAAYQAAQAAEEAKLQAEIDAYQAEHF